MYEFDRLKEFQIQKKQKQKHNVGIKKKKIKIEKEKKSFRKKVAFQFVYKLLIDKTKM